MSVINDVKVKIQAKLAAVTGLAAVVLTDIKKDPLDMELQSYPVAFVMPPAIENAIWLDNRSVQQDLVFRVMTLEKMENVQTTSQIEDLMRDMVFALNNSITFDNVAVAGVLPSTSTPEPFIHNGKTFIVFDIIVRARVVETLTYS